MSLYLKLMSKILIFSHGLKFPYVKSAYVKTPYVLIHMLKFQNLAVKAFDVFYVLVGLCAYKK